jgi:hypothetical protein
MWWRAGETPIQTSLTLAYPPFNSVRTHHPSNFFSFILFYSYLPLMSHPYPPKSGNRAEVLVVTPSYPSKEYKAVTPANLGYIKSAFRATFMTIQRKFDLCLL